jgi:ribonuclease inhibitor
MRTIVIDGNKMGSRKEVHAYLRESLSFQDYYGSNLDALHDCLGEIAEQTHIVICHYDELEKSLGKYAENLLRVITDAAAENDYLTVSRIPVPPAQKSR